MLRKPYPTEGAARKSLSTEGKYRTSKEKVKEFEISIGKGLLGFSNRFKGINKHKELPELDVHEVVLLSMNKNESSKDSAEEVQDNIRAAVDDVMGVTELTRKANTGAKPGLPANKQVLIRATDEDHERWKSAAAELGVSLAEFVRDVCNKAAGTTGCQHLPQDRKVYPWMQRCMKCGKRFTD
jgi:predicted HicB family RNase H-like nuclease